MRQNWTMTMRDTDAAWAAGFMDGEGTIGVYTGGVKKPFLRVVAAQSGTDKPLRRMQTLFGGSVNGPYFYEGKKPQWKWTVTGSRAHVALTLMLPFFSIKGSQAALALTLPIGRRGQHRTDAETMLYSNVQSELKRIKREDT